MGIVNNLEKTARQLEHYKSALNSKAHMAKQHFNDQCDTNKKFTIEKQDFISKILDEIIDISDIL